MPMLISINLWMCILDRIKIGYCKDCFFSSTISDTRRYCLKTKLRCLTIKDIDLENEHDNLMYEYDENGKFYVGDNFGCVHFAEKPEFRFSRNAKSRIIPAISQA